MPQEHYFSSKPADEASLRTIRATHKWDKLRRYSSFEY